MVSTTLGAEGLPVRHGKNILLADEPHDFAAAVVTLLRDPARRAALGEAARTLVQENYSWTRVAADFSAILARVISQTERNGCARPGASTRDAAIAAGR